MVFTLFCCSINNTKIDDRFHMIQYSYACSDDMPVNEGLCLSGMVQAWVPPFVTPLKYTYDKYDLRATSQKPHKKHKSPTKHHHHGGGAARPSSGVDLMNQHAPEGWASLRMLVPMPPSK